MDELLPKTPCAMKPFEIQARTQEILFDLSLRGVRFDESKRLEFLLAQQERQEEIIALLESFSKKADFSYPGWYNSPLYLRYLLFEVFKLKPKVHNKTHNLTTSTSALEELVEEEPLVTALLEPLIELRKISKLISDFLSRPAEKCGDHYRFRPAFNLCGTRTFRLSSSKNPFGHGGNIQNIPRVDKKPNIRELFIPDPGKIIIDIDLERADAQVVAWEAGDELLKEAFTKGEDIHSLNAKTIWGPEAGKAERQLAKTFVHGTNYGASARTIAIQLKIKIAQAQAAQDIWFRAHPGIRNWHSHVARSLPHVSNKLGYSITFLDTRANNLNKALAWIPQSTVGLVTNIGMIQIAENLPEVEILFQVHDSIVLQAPDESYIPEILTQMKVPIPYPDPLVIPCGFKSSRESWGDCK